MVLDSQIDNQMCRLAAQITERQLTGRDEAHVVSLGGDQRLHPAAAQALAALQCDARDAGFDLAVASSFRSFARQRAIWNDKLCGRRVLHDDDGCVLQPADLDDAARLRAVLRFSAMPGASRHHWGTDLDIFDASALGAGERVQLIPEETMPGGVFDAMHRWLDARMLAGQSHGFFRPYSRDCGGVAPERWHLSFAPLSRHLAPRLTAQLLRDAWAEGQGDDAVLYREQLEAELDELLPRYVAVPPGWSSIA